MCSSCGGRAAARRLPGGTPQNALPFGQPDGRAAQPATILVATATHPVGKYAYVSGDGVEKAVEDGLIAIGYKQTGITAPRPRAKPKTNDGAPPFYVKTGRNKWVGFKSKAAAARYAGSVNGTVLTRDEVLKAQGES